ncbi:hypothetical protein EZ428_12835 [Pedobacter frigiditerrae]|uniref:Uncharacterized protein n=1 Tax=Pedobacter frigiditerrae TaxID=2530452 RepID=A0A4V2MIF8_9SPHI|nr:hypothetical protein [Pedobacter frigiditerrae]TCC90166.1 hypothetical protein EZ428_12835 [Pedobacter frigiditerrae]
MIHKFHIPVLGLGFSIDTPLKVAKYGISSVVSVVDDELIERMREYHCKEIEYIPIPKKAEDSRARRITCYLNMLDKMVDYDFENMKKLPFVEGNELCRYFEMLPDDSQLKQGYELMMEYPDGERKTIFQNILLKRMEKGAIDVNIMAKVDRVNHERGMGFTGDENSDALAALRGFAKSRLKSSLVLSAGMNPRLYSYLEEFADFYPDENNVLKKKIILKVSDFRSAFIQAKFLAKKGIWVSEFRVESGLNCGGHAFATAGYLLGPILEEFKQMKRNMLEELFTLYVTALNARGIKNTKMQPQKLSVQGGIGTAQENEFLLQHYKLDSTGWGSPFLLVPETTNVDKETLQKLTNANEESFFLSNSSPLGILFNNFRNSGIDIERLERVKKGKPGSPCTKKYLCTNTEFTAEPICTASRKYQRFKINELKGKELSIEEFERRLGQVTEKVCLCEGLCSSTYQKIGILKPKESKAVAICPGPNLAYFSRIYSLDEMVGHIYGKVDLLEKVKRPNFFIKELDLYINYLNAEIKTFLEDVNAKKQLQLIKFKTQLLNGIDYYKYLCAQFSSQNNLFKTKFYKPLMLAEAKLNGIII